MFAFILIDEGLKVQRGYRTYPGLQDQVDIILKLDLKSPNCLFEIFPPVPLTGAECLQPAQQGTCSSSVHYTFSLYLPYFWTSCLPPPLPPEYKLDFLAAPSTLYFAEWTTAHFPEETQCTIWGFKENFRGGLVTEAGVRQRGAWLLGSMGHGGPGRIRASNGVTRERFGVGLISFVRPSWAPSLPPPMNPILFRTQHKCWKWASFGLGAHIAARNKWTEALVERICDWGTHPGQSPTARKRIVLETLLFLEAQM